MLVFCMICHLACMQNACIFQTDLKTDEAS